MNPGPPNIPAMFYPMQKEQTANSKVNDPKADPLPLSSYARPEVCVFPARITPPGYVLPMLMLVQYRKERWEVK
jgi:hypothetical protein